MKALLLIGSPKARGSASYVLGARLAEGIRTRGGAVAEGFVERELRSEEGTARLLDAFDASDLVVFAFPVYVDSLPAPMTRLLELAAGRRERTRASGSPRLAAIVQCGFPEAAHCATAVAICRLFAERTGMRWGGALAMGMGGLIGGGLEKVPGGGKNLVDALEMAAAALSDGGVIPDAAAALFARPLMPRWLYLLGGNLGWRRDLRKNRARRPISYRPYPQS